jgi:hypothetical protein
MSPTGRLALVLPCLAVVLPAIEAFGPPGPGAAELLESASATAALPISRLAVTTKAPTTKRKYDKPMSCPQAKQAGTPNFAKFWHNPTVGDRGLCKLNPRKRSGAVAA